jgi:hypothetical protein
MVKECMTGAAARYGRDGKGTDGMEGFWDGVAKRNPEFLAAAITKSCVPPATKEDEAGSGGGGVLSVTIISIPHDHSVCPDGHTRPNFEAKPLWEAEHARQKSEGTPLLQLEHSAVIEQEMVEVEPEPRPEPIEPVSEPVPEPMKLELVTPRYIRFLLVARFLSQCPGGIRSYLIARTMRSQSTSRPKWKRDEFRWQWHRRARKH